MVAGKDLSIQGQGPDLSAFRGLVYAGGTASVSQITPLLAPSPSTLKNMEWLRGHGCAATSA